MKIAIIASEFNKKITDNLIDGAILELKNHGYDDSNYEIFYVPGAFEIPSMASNVLNQYQSTFDAIVTLGCIIKGETAHFEYISSSVFNALSKLSIDKNTNIPIILGILTTYNINQAIDRSDLKNKNKGAEVIQAALKSIENFKNI